MNRKKTLHCLLLGLTAGEMLSENVFAVANINRDEPSTQAIRIAAQGASVLLLLEFQVAFLLLLQNFLSINIA